MYAVPSRFSLFFPFFGSRIVTDFDSTLIRIDFSSGLPSLDFDHHHAPALCHFLDIITWTRLGKLFPMSLLLEHASHCILLSPMLDTQHQFTADR
jgi:hypothetical protein